MTPNRFSAYAQAHIRIENSRGWRNGLHSEIMRGKNLVMILLACCFLTSLLVVVTPPRVVTFHC